MSGWKQQRDYLKKRILFVILLVCILGGLAWAVLRGAHIADPIYRGKHLSQWIYQSDFPSSLDEEASAAVRAIGTNAVPYLICGLAAEDSKLKKWLLELQVEGWFGKFHIQSAKEHSEAATRGMLVLGKTALPGAMQGLTNADGRYRLGSETALTLLDESSPEITRLLLERLNDDYEPARTQAAITLAVLRKQPEIVVPGITRLLDDTDPNVRQAAANALLMFGAQAKPAVPKLLKMVADTNDQESRLMLEMALKAIDPEAATKAGIK